MGYSPVYHRIVAGPDALAVSIHAGETGSRSHESLQFSCPSFKESIPSNVGLKPEVLDIKFDSFQTESDCVFFTGMVIVSSEGCDPIHGQPVYGLYSKKTGKGWLCNDKGRSSECYLI